PPAAVRRRYPSGSGGGKVRWCLSLRVSLRQLVRCLMDGSTDARIGAAAADIAAHGLVDLLFGGCGAGLEQAYRRHDLPRLAIAALGDVLLDPGLLHHLAHWIGLHAFNGGYRSSGHVRDRCDAGADRRAIHMHRAGAAQRHAAAELGAGHAQLVTQRPEQRHVVGDVEVPGLTIDLKLWHGELLASGGGAAWLKARWLLGCPAVSLVG